MLYQSDKFENKTMSESNRTFVVRETNEMHGTESLVAQNYPEWCVCKWNSDGTRLTPIAYRVRESNANSLATRLFKKYGNSGN